MFFGLEVTRLLFSRPVVPDSVTSWTAAKFAQVHCVGDAIQPPHPLMPSSPSTLSLAQHQGLFQ